MKSNNTCDGLSPALVFDHFRRITAIPRPSKHEEKMIAYLVSFGESRGLETKVDATGNVLIRKPATLGYESKPTITFQSHMDMVCDKLVDKDFDFFTQGIQTYIDGEWLCADGTTLGADDGIGCAMQLALLDSTDIAHGEIECLFTVDEETGLTGAEGLQSDFIRGQWLINLDSEDEGQLFVSCAGGRTTTATFSFCRETVADDYRYLCLSVKGLLGGHSGDDINKNRANAIKVIARFLYETSEKVPCYLASWNSGRMHNAIPRDGSVVVAIPATAAEQIRADWNIYQAAIEQEYYVSESAMTFSLSSAEAVPVIPQEVSKRIISALYGVANGVYAMCQAPELSWLVETSSNVASVVTSDEKVTIVLSQRSSVASRLDEICGAVAAVMTLAGAEVSQGDGYPGWQMKANSQLTAVAVETYTALFGEAPKVLGIHAGLECGLFSERYPEIEMISMGPTLRNVHTPDEKLFIPSVDKVWRHILAILQY